MARGILNVATRSFHEDVFNCLSKVNRECRSNCGDNKKVCRPKVAYVVKITIWLDTTALARDLVKGQLEANDSTGCHWLFVHIFGAARHGLFVGVRLEDDFEWSHESWNKMDTLYSVCHAFRLTKQDDYFWVNFDHFWSEHHFLRQLGQLWKSAWAYKLQILAKLSLPKSLKPSVDSSCFQSAFSCTVLVHPYSPHSLPILLNWKMLDQLCLQAFRFHINSNFVIKYLQ